MRIDPLEHMLDGAALARGVHALQHEQHAALAAAQALRVEALLVLADLDDAFREYLGRVILAAAEAGTGCRIDLRKLDIGCRAQLALDAHAHTLQVPDR